jgi:hypothetical protein
MRYGDAAGFRMALEQRLRDRAPDGASLARDRKRVAFDRLLARLVMVAEGRWVLKGGFALDLRLDARARSTKDVDIEWRAPEREMMDALLDAAAEETGDFFTFTIERTGPPEDQLGGSHRFRISASLAGRPFETFFLDVGFRTDGPLGSEPLLTDELLGFAGIDRVQIEAVPLELQLAEKLHAYTRTYEGGRDSTRVKDLVDLVLIAKLSRPDAAALGREVKTIFALRETHVPPLSLTAPPAGWTIPFRRLALEVGIAPRLEAGHREAAAMLDPVLSGEVTEGRWNPTDRAWPEETGGRH